VATLVVAGFGSIAVGAPAQDAPARRGIDAPPPAATSPATPPPPTPPETTPTATTPADRAPLDAKWVGAWIGSAKLPAPEGQPAPELPLFFVVRAPASGPTVGIWSLPAGVQGKTADDVAANGRSLAFTLVSQGASARFEATLAEGDAAVAGEMRFLDLQRREDMGLKAGFSMRRVDIVSEVADSRVFNAALEVGASLGLDFPVASPFEVPAGLGFDAVSVRNVGGRVALRSSCAWSHPDRRQAGSRRSTAS
jgi:hypothetical protein